MTQTKVIAGLMIGFLVLCALPFFAAESRGVLEGNPLGGLKVHNQSGKHWVEWKREEAVKFALDQVVTTIRYLFAAAAAGIAFIGKLIVEPKASAAPAGPPAFGKSVQATLVVVAVLWMSSLVCGMAAHLSLAEVGTAEAFSIYGPVGWYVFFQLAYFAVGLMVFLVALVRSI